MGVGVEEQQGKGAGALLLQAGGLQPVHGGGRLRARVDTAHCERVVCNSLAPGKGFLGGSGLHDPASKAWLLKGWRLGGGCFAAFGGLGTLCFWFRGCLFPQFIRHCWNVTWMIPSHDNITTLPLSRWLRGFLGGCDAGVLRGGLPAGVAVLGVGLTGGRVGTGVSPCAATVGWLLGPLARGGGPVGQLGVLWRWDATGGCGSSGVAGVPCSGTAAWKKL